MTMVLLYMRNNVKGLKIITFFWDFQNRQRDFKNKEEALECVDSKGTELVNMCKDELSQTSARIKLSDLNESWGDTLNSLSTREEKLREGLTLAEKYQVLYC